MSDLDQIAAEAAKEIEVNHQDAFDVIKAAIEKAYAEGKAIGYRQGKITRAAQASEKKESGHSIDEVAASSLCGKKVKPESAGQR